MAAFAVLSRNRSLLIVVDAYCTAPDRTAMESTSQATIDALLEELNTKDEHIKQVSAVPGSRLVVRERRF